jgi:hypothetical protein
MTTLARLALAPDIRARCEATIERLIAFLDQFEPDADLEPSLGYYPPHVPWDAESDHAGGVADDEPLIGAPESTNCRCDTDSQEFNWSLPGADDCENDPAENGIADHDGLADDASSRHRRRMISAARGRSGGAAQPSIDGSYRKGVTDTTLTAQTVAIPKSG